MHTRKKKLRELLLQNKNRLHYMQHYDKPISNLIEKLKLYFI